MDQGEDFEIISKDAVEVVSSVGEKIYKLLNLKYANYVKKISNSFSTWWQHSAKEFCYLDENAKVLQH